MNMQVSKQSHKCFMVSVYVNVRPYLSIMYYYSYANIHIYICVCAMYVYAYVHIYKCNFYCILASTKVKTMCYNIYTLHFNFILM